MNIKLCVRSQGFLVKTPDSKQKISNKYTKISGSMLCLKIVKLV